VAFGFQELVFRLFEDRILRLALWAGIEEEIDLQEWVCQ